MSKSPSLSKSESATENGTDLFGKLSYMSVSLKCPFLFSYKNTPLSLATNKSTNPFSVKSTENTPKLSSMLSIPDLSIMFTNSPF